MISVAVDWGSSSFRAYRFDSKANCIDSVQSDKGIKFVASGHFESVLREQIGQWLCPGDTVLFSGMITSRNGWVESEYLPCPANLACLVEHGRRLSLADMECIFLPGVNQLAPADVMRGEELQILGALEGLGPQHFVIPGTHSKWSLIENGAVQQFRTIPTGELFDLVVNHSLMGALTRSGVFDEAAFARGVEVGHESSTPISDLFTTRSSVLMGLQRDEEAHSWLSGMLIGNEIREGRMMMETIDSTVVLIGDERLCHRYLRAFGVLGMPVELAGPDVAVSGYQKIIRHESGVNQGLLEII